MLPRNKGFTLIELLVVVAIIGIIVAIAVPNLLRSVQRAKLNRTLTDLRTIITGLAAYNVDHDHYPIRTDFTSLVHVVHDDGFDTYYNGPVEDSWNLPYRYRTNADGTAYMVKSFGANKVHNNTTGDFEDPETWVDTTCTNVAFHELDAVVEKGCDIVFLNGILAEKFD